MSNFKTKSMLVAAVLALLCTISVTARASCQPLSLSASPATVAPGGIETILISVASCSAAPTFEHVAVSIESSACSLNESMSFQFAVGSHENRTVSFSFPAPQCAGMYTVSATATGSTTTASFTVE